MWQKHTKLERLFLVSYQAFNLTCRLRLQGSIRPHLRQIMNLSCRDLRSNLTLKKKGTLQRVRRTILLLTILAKEKTLWITLSSTSGNQKEKLFSTDQNQTCLEEQPSFSSTSSIITWQTSSMFLDTNSLHSKELVNCQSLWASRWLKSWGVLPNTTTGSNLTN